MKRIILLAFFAIGFYCVFGQVTELALPLLHTKGINSLQFSPCSKYLLSASNDKTVIEWDAENGTVHRKYEGNTARYSPDGKYIVSVTSYNVFVWDASSGNLLQTFDRYSLNLIPAFSPDSKQIAIATASGAVFIYDVSSGKLLHKTGKKLKAITSLAYSRDGKRMITLANETLKLWDIEKGKLVRSFDCLNFSLEQNMFNPTCEKIVLGGKKGYSAIYDVQTGEEIQKLIDPNDVSLSEKEFFYSTQFSPDGQYVAVHADGKIKLWSVETGKLVFTLWEGSYYEFSNDSKMLVLACSDSTAKLRDCKNGDLVQSLGQFNHFTSLATSSPDGKYVAACPVFTSLSSEVRIIIWCLLPE